MSVSVHCPLMRRLQAPRHTDIIAGDSMDQLPNLGREQEMLLEMGLKSMDELFEDIPEDVRRADPSHSGTHSPRRASWPMHIACWVQTYTSIHVHHSCPLDWPGTSYHPWFQCLPPEVNS